MAESVGKARINMITNLENQIILELADHVLKIGENFIKTLRATGGNG